MNILLINHYAGSPDMGMEFRPYYMAREWVKKGHKVTIIAGDYSHLRRKNPHVVKDFQKDRIDRRITYLWLKTGKYEGNGVRRAFTMFRFVGKLMLRARLIAKKLKPDVVIASSTYPIDTFAAQRIARLADAKVIHEVHDMWPATLTEVGGMSKKNPFVVLMQIGENSAYKHSDYVVSLLEFAKDYMMEHGLQPDKFVHINNGIVLEDWKRPKKMPEEHREVINRIRQKGQFIVGYFGGHAISNALDVILAVAGEIDDDKIHFVLVGDGVEKKRLMEKAKEMKLQNITFLPPVSKHAVPDLVSCFDCIYIGAKASPLYRFGIAMNKVFDSMMGGKPLLYAIDSPSDFATFYQCGVKVKPEEIDSIINGIKKIKSMSEDERRQLGENGRHTVLQYFEYSILANQFLEIMQ